MPKVKLDIKELVNTPLPKLPYLEEFLLYLYNNNYSKNTIYNYYRDLTFFACFLKDFGIDFKDITKQHITYYKGWLKERKHIEFIHKYLKKAQKSAGVKDDQLGEALGQGTDGLVETPEHRKNSAVTEYNLQKEEKKSTYDPWKSFKGGYAKNNNPEELDAASINRALVALRNYLRFLIENDYPTPILPDHVKLVREGKKMPKVPSLQDVIALVEAPTKLEKDPFVAKRNRAILELLLSTGMRISELVSINRDQINPEGKLFVTGKGRKERLVYLTPRAMKYIKEYLALRKDPYPALFVPKRRGSSKTRQLGGNKDPRLSTNYIQMKIAEYRRRLGLVVPISAHSIRHAFATYMVERGANPAVLQVLLGHESLRTTTKYVHTSNLLAEREHAKFHPVPSED